MPHQLELFRASARPTARPTLGRLVDRHLAAITASRAVRESAWETAQQLIELRRRKIRVRA